MNIYFYHYDMVIYEKVNDGCVKIDAFSNLNILTQVELAIRQKCGAQPMRTDWTTYFNPRKNECAVFMNYSNKQGYTLRYDNSTGDFWVARIQYYAKKLAP